MLQVKMIKSKIACKPAQVKTLEALGLRSEERRVGKEC